MSDRPTDGLRIDEAEVEKLKCPGCGEPLGLKTDKPEQGVDHPDCKLRIGVSPEGATATAGSKRYVVTVARLEVPIRTFKEDKAAQKEAQQEAKQEAKQAEKDEEAAKQRGAGRPRGT